MYLFNSNYDKYCKYVNSHKKNGFCLLNEELRLHISLNTDSSKNYVKE